MSLSLTLCVRHENTKDNWTKSARPFNRCSSLWWWLLLLLLLCCANRVTYRQTSTLNRNRTVVFFMMLVSRPLFSRVSNIKPNQFVTIHNERKTSRCEPLLYYWHQSLKANSGKYISISQCACIESKNENLHGAFHRHQQLAREKIARSITNCVERCRRHLLPTVAGGGGGGRTAATGNDA